MEIYKLTDEVSEGGRRGRRGGELTHEELRRGKELWRGEEAGNGKLIVTEMKQGVKNPNRVNVFVNGKYALSLDIPQVIDLKVKVGREVTKEELTELKKASEFGKLYQRALEWVLMRPRSERELRDYLGRKLRKSSSDTFSRSRLHGAPSLLVDEASSTKSSEDILELSDKIIEKLKTKKYIDNEEFARFWVENRFVKKGVSKRRLTQELRQKGIGAETIEKVLEESGRDEREEIKKMIERKRKKYDDEKLMAYLVRQGFSYDLVKDCIKHL